MPKRDFKKDPNLRENETEYQVCRFCGQLYPYGDTECPNCARKPTDEEKLTDMWSRSEQK